MQILVNDQSERMVNYQISQYKILKFIFNLFCVDVFQYVRDILQLSLYLDHPVGTILYKKKQERCSNGVPRVPRLRSYLQIF